MKGHIVYRIACTDKADEDLPRYGKKWSFIPNIPATQGALPQEQLDGTKGSVVQEQQEGAEQGEQLAFDQPQQAQSSLKKISTDLFIRKVLF